MRYPRWWERDCHKAIMLVGSGWLPAAKCRLKFLDTLSRFCYRVTYHSLGRVDMQLVSRVDQTVRVAGSFFGFVCGEGLLTEHSYKYSVDEFVEVARRVGLESRRVWVDGRGLFSVHCLEAV